MHICHVCVCVYVDVCVVSVTLSLLVPPPPFISRLACYPLAWGGVWQRDNPCRYVPLTPRCFCLLRFLGNSAISHSLSPVLFFFCYKYSSGHMLPQFTAELMVFVRAQGVWKWFDLPLWKLHYLGHSPTLGLRGVMLDLRQVCEDPEPHWHQASLTSSDTNRNCSRPEKCASMRQIWR